MILLLLFITQVYSLDVCRQLSTYEKCIGSKSEYCRWFPNQHYCRQSMDLVQGCDSNLSLKLCMLQVSTTQSTQALCIFDTICHPIYDSTKSKCSQNLNKYGCLGVLNKSQYCKWDDGKCVELTSDEFTNINTIFPTLELSISVCPLIQGYLIAHSNLIQKLLTTAIEYALLAQDDQSQISTEYEEGTLQNNYVDQDGKFIWFEPLKQQQYNIQQLQINDINRNGCIGIDISDDSMYRKLFNLNHQKVLYGVNHIFCQYININPFITQISVFLNDECQILQTDEFVNKTDIQCQNLGRYACQLAHPSLNCEVKEPINQYEISCQYNENQIANDDCQKLIETATSKKCSQSNTYCFFDFENSKGYCDNGCYNLNNKDCIQKSNCIWIDANSDLFINCIPQNGCNQKGLSQIYCRDIPLNCIWQNDQCQYGDLRILTCQDANNKYSCVNIQRQDQLCIWYNDQCINTLTHNLFKNYYSLPQNIIRNRNQCVLQDKLYYRYNEFNKQCIQDYIIDTQNLKNINKYFCLNLQLYTQWNHDTLNCEIIQPNTICDTRENINPQLCTLFPNCIYDEINQTCKLSTTEQIKCNTKGQQKQQCLSNNNELCQWKNKQCDYVKQFDTCSQLVNVSPLTCQLIQNEKCSYINGSCINSINNNNNECLQYMNQIQCQQQQNECYYNQYQCYLITDNTIYQQLNCNGLSQLSCIKSLKQKCIWQNSQCQIYNQQYFENCDDQVNLLGCLAKYHKGKLYQNHFCQFDTLTNKCEQNNNQINDCGNNLNINIHRCMVYTQLKCFYQNYQCQSLSNDLNLQIQQLDQLKCDQVNINICKNITTQDQICILQNRNNFKYCINITYTSLYSEIYTCLELNIKIEGNRNICSLASDSCYYDYTNNKCQIQNDISIQYSCNDIISKILCLTQTKDSCIYVNNQCKFYNNSFNNIFCNLRNKNSCENNGRNCIWDSNTNQCIDSENYCIQTYNLNSNICQNGMGICFSGQNGCISQSLINLPCNIGLSKQLCFQQQQICIWQNNKCIDYPLYIEKCSQAENVNECLAIQHLNCIFYKNQCIQDNTGIEQSDYFQYESYQYCMTHPYDIYLTSQMCIQLLGEQKNLNFDLDNTFNMQCQLANTMITCVHQRSADCTYKLNKCSTIKLQQCIQEENVYHSPLTCQSIDNCYWHTNKLGQGFCYQNELKCENIILKSLCLSDMGLYCKYVNNQCLTAEFNNCDSIQNIQINYSTCQKLQPNCFYDFQNKLCKKITRQKIKCNDANNLYDCVFSLQNKCLITYNGIIYQQCTVINDSQYNININHYACIQLIDDYYMYDLKTYQCLQISDDVFDCNNLNKKSCLQKTKQLKCIWLDSECIYYKQNMGLNCDQLNQQVCLQFTDKVCIWLNNECIEFTNQNDVNIQYSQGYCQSIQQLWYKNICYNTNDIFNILTCNNMGLNKQQCLNQVNIECYWNNNKCTSLLDDINYDCNNISKYNCDSEFKCKWNQQNNLCEDNISINLQCDQYTYNSCIQLSNNDCIYVQQLNKCQVINQRVLTLNKCNENLSFQLCKEVINEICTIYDLICQQWTPRLFDCMYIQNYYGCMYAPLSCQWLNNQCQRIIDQNKYNCIDIPKNYNKKGCIEYSIDPCQFDDTLQQCTYKIIYTNQLTNINFKQIPQTINCNINKTYNECMNDWLSICQWENDLCITSNQQQCNNQNFQGCLNNEQFCKWRNGKCYQFDYQTNNENIPTLVTYKVCKYFNTQLKLKYDNQSYSCILSNLDIDDCDTIGLNEQSCYKINKSACIYNNNGCQFYQNNDQINKCKDIKNVNAKVCQQLSIPCKFDSQINSCIDITDIDLCNSDGLSKQGCINIQSEPCYWDQNQCKQFIIDQSIDQCDNQTFTNKIACQYIEYQQQPCEYDTQNNVCSKQFNRFSLCNTPGLNKYACYQTQLEPCIFQQNQCIQFTNNTEECYFIRNTNSLSCSIQTTQPCTYQQSKNNCVGVPITIPCNSKGINEIACQLQKDCLWNIDTLQCVYKTTKNINQCYNSNQDTCISLQNCYYENNQCRLKRCRDLNKEECLINQQLNNEYCYLDIFNQCQIAQKCEDIIQLNEQQQCSLFFINNVSCYQINNQCITSTSYDIICPQSDCLNTNCIKDSGICRALQCSDYLTQQNCPNKDCAFIDEKCQFINTCSDLQDSIICNEIIVKNEQCSWQPTALRIGPYHCTSKPCYLFGSSTVFCQGNEMNDQVCFITSYAQCESCEEQTDQATCLSSKFCQFVDNKCKSILCRYFTDEKTCTVTNRCYWSTQDKICRKQCIKIVEKDACDLLDYECNWNALEYTCQSGPEFNLDLSFVVDSPEKKQQIIKFILIIIYLFL